MNKFSTDRRIENENIEQHLPHVMVLIAISVTDLIVTSQHFQHSKYFQWFTSAMSIGHCLTQMTYWTKNYVTILTRAAHWMTYEGYTLNDFDLRQL